jgi:ATP-dependent DNA ligase
LVGAAKALGPERMILDGAAVVVDEQGRSDLGMVQKSLGASGRQGGKVHRNRPCRSRRTGDRLKIKCIQNEALS